MSVVEATGPIKFAKIDAAAGGDRTLVGAVTAKKIRVLLFHLMQDAAGSVVFESNAATALTGVMETTAENLTISAPFSPVGHFETVAGEPLTVAPVTGNCYGWLVYQEVS